MFGSLKIYFFTSKICPCNVSWIWSSGNYGFSFFAEPNTRPISTGRDCFYKTMSSFCEIHYYSAESKEPDWLVSVLMCEIFRQLCKYAIGLYRMRKYRVKVDWCRPAIEILLNHVIYNLSYNCQWQFAIVTITIEKTSEKEKGNVLGLSQRPPPITYNEIIQID